MAATQPPARTLLPGVKYVIAVASGKGGVGKSTTAVNLALALAARGAAVGILDADVYGPSLPRMLDIHYQPDAMEEAGNKRILPVEVLGVKAISMGFFMPEATPMVWRGPMVGMAVEQLLRDVEWGTLDYLVVDLPPGTGDAQLTLTQRVPLTGVVIVSTPQDVALADVRKGINMFRKVDVPVLGIIENMSYHLCPNCGHRSDIFSHGGARREAEAAGLHFLGEVPLDQSIREHADSGKPIVITDPQSPQAVQYLEIARLVAERVEAMAATESPFPSIVVE